MSSYSSCDDPSPHHPRHDIWERLALLLLQYLAAQSLAWLLGFSTLDWTRAPFFALARRYPIVAAFIGGTLFVLVLVALRAYLPPIKALTRWLTATRWRVVLVILLALGIIATELYLSLAHTVPDKVPMPVALRYVAAVPGPHCAPGRNRWEQRTDMIALSCTSKGMEMRVAAGGFGEVTFDPRGLLGNDTAGALLPNYCVQVDTTVIMGGPGTEVSVGVHGQNPGAQLAGVTVGGAATIVRYDRQGRPDAGSALVRAKIRTNRTRRLTVGVSGAVIRLWVAGTLVAQAMDQTYTTTAYVLLALVANDGTADAVFSNFVFSVGNGGTCSY